MSRYDNENTTDGILDVRDLVVTNAVMATDLKT